VGLYGKERGGGGGGGSGIPSPKQDPLSGLAPPCHKKEIRGGPPSLFGHLPIQARGHVGLIKEALARGLKKKVLDGCWAATSPPPSVVGYRRCGEERPWPPCSACTGRSHGPVPGRRTHGSWPIPGKHWIEIMCGNKRHATNSLAACM